MTTKLHRIKSALRESIEIASKATEGPWTPDGISVWSGETHVCYTSQSDEDSEFLAHARTMTPLACKALLTAIEGLERIAYIQSESTGIAGWHRNGDVMQWDEMEFTPQEALASITSEWPDV